MKEMFDLHTRLWSELPERYFEGLKLRHRMQVGGSCVSTCMSLLTREDPEDIRRRLNTQDPVSWSRYLQTHGMKLAYCVVDFRRLRHFAGDLLELDDLFTISTYSPSDPASIGNDPNEEGWICSSHLMLLYRSAVYDTRYPEPIELEDHPDLDRYVKRLFRVVPAWHSRGL